MTPFPSISSLFREAAFIAQLEDLWGYWLYPLTWFHQQHDLSRGKKEKYSGLQLKVDSTKQSQGASLLVLPEFSGIILGDNCVLGSLIWA
jgi:hypothetical protein